MIARRHRAFTLLEALATIIVLSIATPPAVSMLQEAAGVRRDAAAASRGHWLAVATLEHIIADMHSDAEGRGFEALNDPQAYLNDQDDGLYARMADTRAFYAQRGVECAVEISGLVGHDGLASGDPELDVYRYIRVIASWTGARGGAAEASVGALVTDL